MTKPDREDAVARALDILPTGDPSASDPRLLRDPALQEEARAAREAAADVWLAVSPLRAAPPDVLHSVMDKIGLPQAAMPERRIRIAPLLAASGWAAAAAIAFCLWPHRPSSQTPVIVAEPPAPASKSSDRDRRATVSAAPGRAPALEDHRLEQEVARLKKRFAAFRESESAIAPRVMSLSAPGTSRKTPEETRQRVRAALSGGLRSSMEIESGAPSDPAALVIERGYLPDGLGAPDEGTILRHRNFPQESWEELGLMRSDDGAYYDPSRHLLWTREPSGTSFVGKKVDKDADLSAYKPPDEIASVTKAPYRAEPEGFVIEDPMTNQAEVMIDQVPPPAEGNEQKIVWVDATGATGSMTVNALTMSTANAGAAASGNTGIPLASGSPTVFYPFNNFFPADGSGLGTLFFTIPNSGGLRSFQLIESSILGNAGVAPRVIVSGGQ